MDRKQQRWLHYQHLFYFWMVAQEGGVTAAARRLRLAQPTISAQLRTLEDVLGVDLFVRQGRRIELSETGRTVFSYADEIFRLGSELISVLDGGKSSAREVLRVGVADVLPKALVHQFLEPSLRGSEAPLLHCREGNTHELLAELALRDLDIVLSDRPAPPTVRVKVFNHSLGQCGVSFLAERKIARKLRTRFPQSLTGTRMFLPSRDAAVRAEIDRWFETQQIAPDIAGEFQDSALMKRFGRSGAAVFPVPTAAERILCRELDTGLVGRINEPIENFYLISVERKIRRDCVLRITESAAGLHLSRAK